MKKFLTSQEAADYLGMSEEGLQGLIDKGELPSYKIGGLYTRFKVDDLNVYRRKIPNIRDANSNHIIDRVKDFFYFNDFYIYSFIAILVMLYFIFR